MRRLLLCTAAALLAAPASAQMPGEGGTNISRYYKTRVTLIQLVGISYTGEFELASQGSGYLVDDRHILTSNHVVPDVADRYETLQTNIRLGTRSGKALKARVVARDPANDLALLELETPLPPEPHCPVGVLMPPAELPMGSILYAMGFPLDRDASISGGILSSAGENGRWQTDAAINKSSSGGPIFSSKGYLVAIAYSGTREYTLPDKEYKVEGINDVIAISQLTASPVGQWLKQNSTSGCWQEQTWLPEADEYAWRARPQQQEAGVAPPPPEDGAGVGTDGDPDYANAAADAPSGMENDSGWAQPDDMLPAPDPEPPLLDKIGVLHTLSTVKDDHGALTGKKTYRRKFNAESGFLIEGCEFSAVSANHESDVSCIVAPDGRSATMQFTLKSGPVYDRWRGWLRGTVMLDQRSAGSVEGPLKQIVETVRIPVETVQSEHAGLTPTSKSYEVSHSAAPGFEIAECTFEPLSDNNADAVDCSIDATGSRASLTYELTSGPAFDQWRGWLKGDLVVKLAKAN